MKGKVFSWFRGTVRILIKGGSCERFLNLCAFHRINLWNLHPEKEGYTAWVTLDGFRRIRPLIRKSGAHIRITGKSGLPFFLYQNRRRKMIFAAILTACFSIFFLSLFIWDIRIEGNRTLSDEKIMDYLQEEGIHQGIWKSSIDYKLLASNMRKNFDGITWVSVKLEGTRLLVDLQENTDLRIREEAVYNASDLVSDADGTIVRIITRAGTPLVEAGTEVKKGDILISGRIDLLDDSGSVYGYRYVPADGDIYIQTALSYQDKISLWHQEKEYTGREKTSLVLKFGSAALVLPGLWPEKYSLSDKTTCTMQLKMMENFYLPVYFQQTSIKEYDLTEKKYSKKEAEAVLNGNLNHFLEKIQEKGVQIFQNDVKIEKTDAVCTAKGTIIVIVKAGERADTEQIELQKEGTPQG
ncbi:MAG: sporulation protein YqfD [Lachnospiraceae bacterium]|nr:sporulation protein YqfD [Lachnospiraceae bacterium]